jgi:hypothetical protein
MQVCFRVREEDPERKNAPDDTWREPPGYLGEAVRRAKRIPSRAARTGPFPAEPVE